MSTGKDRAAESPLFDISQETFVQRIGEVLDGAWETRSNQSAFWAFCGNDTLKKKIADAFEEKILLEKIPGSEITVLEFFILFPLLEGVNPGRHSATHLVGRIHLVDCIGRIEKRHANEVARILGKLNAVLKYIGDPKAFFNSVRSRKISAASLPVLLKELHALCKFACETTSGAKTFTSLLSPGVFVLRSASGSQPKKLALFSSAVLALSKRYDLLVGNNASHSIIPEIYQASWQQNSDVAKVFGEPPRASVDTKSASSRDACVAEDDSDDDSVVSARTVGRKRKKPPTPSPEEPSDDEDDSSAESKSGNSERSDSEEEDGGDSVQGVAAHHSTSASSRDAIAAAVSAGAVSAPATQHPHKRVKLDDPHVPPPWTKALPAHILNIPPPVMADVAPPIPPPPLTPISAFLAGSKPASSDARAAFATPHGSSSSSAAHNAQSSFASPLPQPMMTFSAYGAYSSNNAASHSSAAGSGALMPHPPQHPFAPHALSLQHVAATPPSYLPTSVVSASASSDSSMLHTDQYLRNGVAFMKAQGMEDVTRTRESDLKFTVMVRSNSDFHAVLLAASPTPISVDLPPLPPPPLPGEGLPPLPPHSFFAHPHAPAVSASASSDSSMLQRDQHLQSRLSFMKAQGMECVTPTRESDLKFTVTVRENSDFHAVLLAVSPKLFSVNLPPLPDPSTFQQQAGVAPLACSLMSSVAQQPDAVSSSMSAWMGQHPHAPKPLAAQQPFSADETLFPVQPPASFVDPSFCSAATAFPAPPTAIPDTYSNQHQQPQQLFAAAAQPGHEFSPSTQSAPPWR